MKDSDMVYVIKYNNSITVHVENIDNIFYAQFSYKGNNYTLELCKKNDYSIFYIEDIVKHDVLSAVKKVDIEDEMNSYIANNFKLVEKV